MLEQILKQLGLSNKEALVYLAALELGAQSVQNIARKAKVNRPTTYVILESLARKGLASQFTEGKKRYFTAEPPVNLRSLIKKQEAEIKEKERELMRHMPDLEAIFNLSENKPQVKYYEGKDGLKALQDYIIGLPGHKEFWSFTPLDELMSAFPDAEKEIIEPRKKRKYHTTVIYTHKNGPIPEFEEPGHLRKVRYIPYNKFPFKAAVTISNHNVQIIKYSKGFAGVLIENEEIARTFKVIFNLSWEEAKKYSN